MQPVGPFRRAFLPRALLLRTCDESRTCLTRSCSRLPAAKTGGGRKPYMLGTREGAAGKDRDRIINLSDGVFAIAIILLILDVRAPDIPESSVAAELPAALRALWPQVPRLLAQLRRDQHLYHSSKIRNALGWPSVRYLR